MGLIEWNIGKCDCTGNYIVFDRPCSVCGKITTRPNERSSEMNTPTNGGITIGSVANGETSLR